MTAPQPKPIFSRAGLDLFIVSFLSLYYELLVIRWLSSEVRIFAYFKNLPLMACLFGLGLGLALTRSRHNFSRWFPALLLLVTALICFAAPLGLIHIVFVDPVEHYLLGLHQLPIGASSALQYLSGLIILAAIFYLIVFTFVAMGQKLGVLFDEFPPLVAYSINVGASLAGILAFSLISFLCWPPAGWLLLGAILCMWIYRGGLQTLMLVLGIAISFVTAQPNVVWSPYYRISITEWWLPADPPYSSFKYGTNVNVNHDFLEGAFDNRPEVLAHLSPRQRSETWEHYSTLYKIIGDKPRKTLILASGMGNDVAAALRHGATEIDAVEIDPIVVASGQRFHVERPYSNQRVRVHVNDARAFLRRTTEKYDLVDFAYLDSHAAFSSMSSVRLDNYVYTRESFRDAASLLKPDGIMAVHFFATKPWQTARIIKTLTAALGYEPLGLWSETGRALILLAGPGLDRKAALASGYRPFVKQELEYTMQREGAFWDQIEPTTDDWPFLFLRNRSVTFTYAVGLLFTLAIGIRLVGMSFGKFTVSPIGRTMFFLGAAFMLVEVKSVTQMGLLLGTTWFVNSVVIAGILTVILLANLIVIKAQPKKLDWLFALLLLSLLINYCVPLSVFQDLPFITRTVAGTAMLSLPLAFAAAIFAVSFSRARNAHAALGMNLLGTLVGGVLEYISMITGIAALNLVAVGLYGLAWLSWRDLEKESASAPPPAGGAAAEAGEQAGGDEPAS